MSSFFAVLVNVIHCKSAYKNGFHFYCVPCMLEHVGDIFLNSYVNWLNFVYCLKFRSLSPD